MTDEYKNTYVIVNYVLKSRTPTNKYFKYVSRDKSRGRAEEMRSNVNSYRKKCGKKNSSYSLSAIAASTPTLSTAGDGRKETPPGKGENTAKLTTSSNERTSVNGHRASASAEGIFTGAPDVVSLMYRPENKS